MDFNDYSQMLYPAPTPPSFTVRRQQRWVIPQFATRGTTLWTLQQAITEAKAAYHRSSEQTGGPTAEDAITARMEGDDLVVAFESSSGVSAE